MPVDYLKKIKMHRKRVEDIGKENLGKFFKAYRENLFKIITAATMLEDSIDNLITSQLIIIDSQAMAEIFIEDKRRPTTIQKLDFLRFAELIDERDYLNIVCLFEIRNRYAHEVVGFFDSEKILNSMNKIELNPQYSNQFNNMRNDGNKFLRIAMTYSQKILPNIWRSREKAYDERHKK